MTTVNDLSAPIEPLTSDEMRRAAAYLSGVLGLHSAAGKLIAHARRIEEANGDRLKRDELVRVS